MALHLEQTIKRGDRMKKKTGFLGVYLCFGLFLFAETNTSGKIFFNYTKKLNGDGSNAFNIKRAYLTFVNNPCKQCPNS